MPLRIIVLEFKSPYHVGWRRPATIIDHVTVLRAVASIAYSVGNKETAEAIREGRVRATSILPATKAKEGLRLLAPFPPIPSMTKRFKRSKAFATLSTISRLMDVLPKCVKEGLPLIEEEKDVVLKCGDRDIIPLRIINGERKGGVSIASLGSELKLTDIPAYVPVIHYRNRIDRVTGAADVYELRGYRLVGVAWLGLYSEDELVLRKIEAHIALLGELGIGAYKSRGWGRFRILDSSLSVEDVKAISIGRSTLSRGLNYLLGSYPLCEGDIDKEASYCRPTRIEGRAGPTHSEYDLPVIAAASTGCLLNVLRDLGHRVVEVEIDDDIEKPFIVFNPLTIASEKVMQA